MQIGPSMRFRTVVGCKVKCRMQWSWLIHEKVLIPLTNPADGEAAVPPCQEREHVIDSGRVGGLADHSRGMLET